MRPLRSLVVLLLAWTHLCMAQTGDYLSTLDPAQIPTGLLFDQAPPVWRNFEDYNNPYAIDLSSRSLIVKSPPVLSSLMSFAIKLMIP
jgi:hypothetical protein